MITIGGTSQHQASVVGVAWLTELEFTTGTLRFTTAPVTIVSGGDTWLGIGTLGAVSSISESEEITAQEVTLSLSIVDSSMISAALGNVESYRGRKATIYLQLLDETFKPVGNKVRRWVGLMDRVSITRDSSEGGDSIGSIELRCTRAGIARMRNSPGMRLTNEQQLARFPGDTGLRYIRTLLEKPSLWLSKEFQKV